MKISETLKLIISVSIPLVLGSPLGVVNLEALENLVQTLNRPALSPPTWVFPLVWTFMYAAMGISMFLVWELPKSAQRNNALGIYVVQFLFNIIWNLSLFYFVNIPLSIVIMVMLWCIIAVLIYQFYKLRPEAAYLMVPFFLWRSFSLVLIILLQNLNS